MSHSNIPAIRTARKLFLLFAICMFTIIALGTWFSVSSGLPRVMFDHVLLYMLADSVLLWAVMRLVGMLSVVVVLWALNKVWLLYRAFQNPFAASKAREPEEKERERKLFEEELMKVAQQVMAQDAYMAAHPGATREEARKATGTNED
ncbi:TPA: hypothetical protein ACYLN4_000272 [Burkholderia lata]